MNAENIQGDGGHVANANNEGIKVPTSSQKSQSDTYVVSERKQDRDGGQKFCGSNTEEVSVMIPEVVVDVSNLILKSSIVFQL